MGNVLVVGTGTIGKPVIGMLTKCKQILGIDEVAFHKRTPQIETVASTQRRIDRGAKFVTDEESFDAFRKFGLEPVMIREEALAWADVVIDCTPAALAHKNGVDGEASWFKPHEDRIKGFIAQGSEEGFGVPFALDINNEAVNPDEHRYVQVVSCNTHNLLVLLSIVMDDLACPIRRGRFVMLRRATDISQAKNVASPTVDKHKEEESGTHHAFDANRVLETRGIKLDLFSSAIKLPTQYQHTIHFNIEVEGTPPTRDDFVAAIQRRQLVSVTYWNNTGQVFSEARDDGFSGRILDQTVVPVSTVTVRGNEIIGFAFTPQDGNSLLTSAAIVTRYLRPDDWRKQIDEAFRRYQFDVL